MDHLAQLVLGLIYLAMEESAFNPVARSDAKAVGIWQLTADTARLYGLKVSKKVDERTKIEKETDAALHFLSHLHRRFGCWYLAAAAYNTGEAPRPEPEEIRVLDAP